MCVCASSYLNSFPAAAATTTLAMSTINFEPYTNLQQKCVCVSLCHMFKQLSNFSCKYLPQAAQRASGKKRRRTCVVTCYRLIPTTRHPHKHTHGRHWSGFSNGIYTIVCFHQKKNLLLEKLEIRDCVKAEVKCSKTSITENWDW